ncbi:MAG: hypothetical protein ACJA00_001502, partial [Myxococcota bacterium]
TVRILTERDEQTGGSLGVGSLAESALTPLENARVRLSLAE